MKYLVAVTAAAAMSLSASSALASENDLVASTAADPSAAQEYCFRVSGSTTLRLMYDGKFITGQAKDPSCGSGPVLGDVVGGFFTIYRDWTSASCVDGVWYTGEPFSWKYEWINTSGASGTGTMEPINCSQF